VKEEIEEVFDDCVATYGVVDFPISSAILGCDTESKLYYLEVNKAVICYNNNIYKAATKHGNIVTASNLAALKVKMDLI